LYIFKKVLPLALLLIWIFFVGGMLNERMNMEPEILFSLYDYNDISTNGSLFSYNGDSTFLYVTLANIQFYRYFYILCVIGVIISCLDVFINKNRQTLSMLIVYLIISFYTILPAVILDIFNRAIPLISYTAAFLTFQFDLSGLLMITLSYISIIILVMHYLYKCIKPVISIP